MISTRSTSLINHLKSIKVCVLFCFDITSSASSAKAFKVAVPQSEVIKMSNADMWPSSVRIRLWRHSSAVRDKRVPPELGNIIDEGLQTLRIINNNIVSIISPESTGTHQSEGNSCALQTDVATCSPITYDSPTISSANDHVRQINDQLSLTFYKLRMVVRLLHPPLLRLFKFKRSDGACTELQLCWQSCLCFTM